MKNSIKTPTEQPKPLNIDVDIMGTLYEVKDDYCKDDDYGGETRLFTKEIHLRSKDEIVEGRDSTPIEKELGFNQTFRHEIVHAFFFECGMTEYCMDETLVEFVASTAPKLFAIFKKHNLL